MKSIKQHIIELDQSDWDYYTDFSTNPLSNPFQDQTSHSEFIEKYFKRSGKEIVLNLINIKKEEIHKANHTNSIFFLGILLHKNTEVKKEYFKELNPSGYKEFPFIWFLTCLFHDFGVAHESDIDLLNKIYDLDNLKSHLKIDHCLLNRKIAGIEKVLFSHIRQYFTYRRIIHKRIDHGICAGLYFYDRLIKNRIEKEKVRNNELFWGKKLEKQYALVAATIATHNIWFPNDETACDYIKFEMKSLINLKPISLKHYPLLYLLGVVDTIDPIKIFTSSHSDDYIMENLNLSFSTNMMIIENKSDSELDFNKLLLKADNFNGWLNVETKKEKNRLTIIMK
ncbi:hypothetical protein DMA11_21435 [Marinilabiliaceae bacterium JC017]|nr:hypothetical protein DMA11_21435 [Marinilabiliaceae bacterium JC017]